jgi:hypothetical protein
MGGTSFDVSLIAGGQSMLAPQTSVDFGLVIRSLQQLAALIPTLPKTRDVYIDEKLNLLIVRDTPEAVRLVEKLVALARLAERLTGGRVQVVDRHGASYLEVCNNLWVWLGGKPFTTVLRTGGAHAYIGCDADGEEED